MGLSRGVNDIVGEDIAKLRREGSCALLVTTTRRGTVVAILRSIFVI